MAKGFVLLAVAATLDFFQAMIMLAFTGTISATSGLLAFIPVVGAAAASVVSVGGMLAGWAIDVSLSFGFGSFLLMLLLLTNTLSWRSLMWGTPVELLLPFLPGWTMIVAGSLYTTYMAEKAEKLQSDEALA